MPRETTGKDTREQARALSSAWELCGCFTCLKGKTCIRGANIAAALSRARREESDLLLDRIVGTLKEYPKLGGDVRIMAEVDRIRREVMEEAAGIAEGHRPKRGDYDPSKYASCLQFGYDIAAAIRAAKEVDRG